MSIKEVIVFIIILYLIKTVRRMILLFFHCVALWLPSFFSWFSCLLSYCWYALSAVGISGKRSSLHCFSLVCNVLSVLVCFSIVGYVPGHLYCFFMNCLICPFHSFINSCWNVNNIYRTSRYVNRFTDIETPTINRLCNGTI